MRFARVAARSIVAIVSTAAALRSASEQQRPRALKTASREIFRNRRASQGRSAAYRFVASRENAHAYEKSRQDRQSLQTDPVGYEDDLNLYAYVRNDPLNLSDPTGMQSCKDPPCPDVPLPAPEIRQEGAAPLQGSGGSNERGTNTYQNPETGETKTVSGPEAGRAFQQSGSMEGFAHDTREESNGGSRPDEWDTPLLSHKHLESRERSASRSRRSRENNAPSEVDQAAMNSSGAAIQVVGPRVTGTLYRENNQDYYQVDRGSVSDVPDLTSQGIIVVPPPSEPPR